MQFAIVKIFRNLNWPSTNAELQLFNDYLKSVIPYRNQPLNCMPIINRGYDNQALSPYFTTSDDRLIEYGFRKIIFDECSKYQRVQICSTVDYGNLLVLDGAINLAENDTEAYTNALMNLPHVSFDL